MPAPTVVFQNAKGFVTDFGRELEAIEVVPNGEVPSTLIIPRYGVWTKSSRGKYEVVKTTSVLADAKLVLEHECKGCRHGNCVVCEPCGDCAAEDAAEKTYRRIHHC